MTDLATSHTAAKTHISARVARDLAVKMLSGEIKVGETLPSEPVLCAQMGVSRTAFREAVKMLYAKGMVESKPKVGTRVRSKTRWNFLDVQLLEWMVGIETTEDIYKQFMELRQSIEPQACAMSAEHANDDYREQLTNVFKQMEIVAANFNRDDWIEVDTQFHQLIFVSTENCFYVSFGNILTTIFKWFFLYSSKDGSVCIDEHREIYDAIMAREPERAANASLYLMKHHRLALAYNLEMEKAQEN